jgi:hypothetical protein
MSINVTLCYQLCKEVNCEDELPAVGGTYCITDPLEQLPGRRSSLAVARTGLRHDHHLRSVC